MATENMLLARSRPMYIAASEMPAVLALRTEADPISPFDPRLEAMFAAYAFLKWTCDAPETEQDPEDTDIPDPLATDGPVRIEWATNVPHTVAIDHLGHWILLAIESRNQGDNRPLQQKVDPDLASQVDAICCVYVQRDHDGQIGIVLQGWAEDQSLVNGRIPESGLQPMHRLWQRIAVPAQEPRSLILTGPQEYKPSPSWRLWAPLAAAAVLALALILPPLLRRAPVTATAVEMRLVGIHATRGAGGVYVGSAPFRLEVLAATPLRRGWLYHVGRDSASLLAVLGEEKGKALSAQHAGSFVAGQNLGWNYFVVVLADRAPAALALPGAPWITATDRLQLHNAGGDMAAAGRILREAAIAAGAGDEVVVRVEVAEHR